MDREENDTSLAANVDIIQEDGGDGVSPPGHDGDKNQCGTRNERATRDHSIGPPKPTSTQPPQVPGAPRSPVTSKNLSSVFPESQISREDVHGEVSGDDAVRATVKLTPTDGSDDSLPLLEDALTCVLPIAADGRCADAPELVPTEMPRLVDQGDTNMQLPVDDDLPRPPAVEPHDASIRAAFQRSASPKSELLVILKDAHSGTHDDENSRYASQFNALHGRDSRVTLKDAESGLQDSDVTREALQGEALVSLGGAESGLHDSDVTRSAHRSGSRIALGDAEGGFHDARETHHGDSRITLGHSLENVGSTLRDSDDMTCTPHRARFSQGNTLEDSFSNAPRDTLQFALSTESSPRRARFSHGSALEDSFSNAPRSTLLLASSAESSPRKARFTEESALDDFFSNASRSTWQLASSTESSPRRARFTQDSALEGSFSNGPRSTRQLASSTESSPRRARFTEESALDDSFSNAPRDTWQSISTEASPGGARDTGVGNEPTRESNLVSSSSLSCWEALDSEERTTQRQTRICAPEEKHQTMCLLLGVSHAGLMGLLAAGNENDKSNAISQTNYEPLMISCAKLCRMFSVNHPNHPDTVLNSSRRSSLAWFHASRDRVAAQMDAAVGSLSAWDEIASDLSKTIAKEKEVTSKVAIFQNQRTIARQETLKQMHFSELAAMGSLSSRIVNFAAYCADMALSLEKQARSKSSASRAARRQKSRAVVEFQKAVANAVSSRDAAHDKMLQFCNRNDISPRAADTRDVTGSLKLNEETWRDKLFRMLIPSLQALQDVRVLDDNLSCSESSYASLLTEKLESAVDLEIQQEEAQAAARQTEKCLFSPRSQGPQGITQTEEERKRSSTLLRAGVERKRAYRDLLRKEVKRLLVEKKRLCRGRVSISLVDTSGDDTSDDGASQPSEQCIERQHSSAQHKCARGWSRVLRALHSSVQDCSGTQDTGLQLQLRSAMRLVENILKAATGVEAALAAAELKALPCFKNMLGGSLKERVEETFDHGAARSRQLSVGGTNEDAYMTEARAALDRLVVKKRRIQAKVAAAREEEVVQCQRHARWMKMGQSMVELLQRKKAMLAKVRELETAVRENAGKNRSVLTSNGKVKPGGKKEAALGDDARTNINCFSEEVIALIQRYHMKVPPWLMSTKMKKAKYRMRKRLHIMKGIRACQHKYKLLTKVLHKLAGNHLSEQENNTLVKSTLGAGELMQSKYEREKKRIAERLKTLVECAQFWGRRIEVRDRNKLYAQENEGAENAAAKDTKARGWRILRKAAMSNASGALQKSCAEELDQVGLLPDMLPDEADRENERKSTHMHADLPSLLRGGKTLIETRLRAESANMIKDMALDIGFQTPNLALTDLLQTAKHDSIAEQLVTKSPHRKKVRKHLSRIFLELEPKVCDMCVEQLVENEKQKLLAANDGSGQPLHYMDRFAIQRLIGILTRKTEPTGSRPGPTGGERRGSTSDELRGSTFGCARRRSTTLLGRRRSSCVKDDAKIREERLINGEERVKRIMHLLFNNPMLTRGHSEKRRRGSVLAHVTGLSQRRASSSHPRLASRHPSCPMLPFVTSTKYLERSAELAYDRWVRRPSLVPQKMNAEDDEEWKEALQYIREAKEKRLDEWRLRGIEVDHVDLSMVSAGGDRLGQDLERQKGETQVDLLAKRKEHSAYLNVGGGADDMCPIEKRVLFLGLEQKKHYSSLARAKQERMENTEDVELTNDALRKHHRRLNDLMLGELNHQEQQFRRESRRRTSLCVTRVDLDIFVKKEVPVTSTGDDDVLKYVAADDIQHSGALSIAIPEISRHKSGMQGDQARVVECNFLRRWRQKHIPFSRSPRSAKGINTDAFTVTNVDCDGRIYEARMPDVRYKSIPPKINILSDYRRAHDGTHAAAARGMTPRIRRRAKKSKNEPVKPQYVRRRKFALLDTLPSIERDEEIARNPEVPPTDPIPSDPPPVLASIPLTDTDGVNYCRRPSLQELVQVHSLKDMAPPLVPFRVMISPAPPSIAENEVALQPASRFGQQRLSVSSFASDDSVRSDARFSTRSGPTGLLLPSSARKQVPLKDHYQGEIQMLMKMSMDRHSQATLRQIHPRPGLASPAPSVEARMVRGSDCFSPCSLSAIMDYDEYFKGQIREEEDEEEEDDEKKMKEDARSSQGSGDHTERVSLLELLYSRPAVLAKLIASMRQRWPAPLLRQMSRLLRSATATQGATELLQGVFVEPTASMGILRRCVRSVLQTLFEERAENISSKTVALQEISMRARTPREAYRTAIMMGKAATKHANTLVLTREIMAQHTRGSTPGRVTWRMVYVRRLFAEQPNLARVPRVRALTAFKTNVVHGDFPVVSRVVISSSSSSNPTAPQRETTVVLSTGAFFEYRGSLPRLLNTMESSWKSSPRTTFYPFAARTCGGRFMSPSASIVASQPFTTVQYMTETSTKQLLGTKMRLTERGWRRRENNATLRSSRGFDIGTNGEVVSWERCEVLDAGDHVFGVEQATYTSLDEGSAGVTVRSDWSAIGLGTRFEERDCRQFFEGRDLPFLLRCHELDSLIGHISPPLPPQPRRPPFPVAHRRRSPHCAAMNEFAIINDFATAPSSEKNKVAALPQNPRIHPLPKKKPLKIIPDRLRVFPESSGEEGMDLRAPSIVAAPLEGSIRGGRRRPSEGGGMEHSPKTGRKQERRGGDDGHLDCYLELVGGRSCGDTKKAGHDIGAPHDEGAGTPGHADGRKKRGMENNHRDGEHTLRTRRVHGQGKDIKGPWDSNADRQHFMQKIFPRPQMKPRKDEERMSANTKDLININSTDRNWMGNGLTCDMAILPPVLSSRAEKPSTKPRNDRAPVASLKTSRTSKFEPNVLVSLDTTPRVDVENYCAQWNLEALRGLLDDSPITRGYLPTKVMKAAVPKPKRVSLCITNLLK